MQHVQLDVYTHVGLQLLEVDGRGGNGEREGALVTSALDLSLNLDSNACEAPLLARYALSYHVHTGVSTMWLLASSTCCFFRPFFTKEASSGCCLVRPFFTGSSTTCFFLRTVRS